jgi:hypothetical protein
LNDVRCRFGREARTGRVEHLFEAGKGIHNVRSLPYSAPDRNQGV